MACNSRFKLATSHRNAAANCVQPAANLACWLGGLLLLLILLILLLLLLLLLPGGGVHPWFNWALPTAPLMKTLDLRGASEARCHSGSDRLQSCATAGQYRGLNNWNRVLGPSTLQVE